MKNVLIILYYGVIITVIKAAFEPIPFSPKFDYLSSNFENTAKITGINYTPYNISALKCNQFISELNYNLNALIFEAKSVGDNLYQENKYSLHYKSKPKSSYRTVIGINHYQVHIENYGEATLNTVDFGLKFHLFKDLNTFVLFQNILKDKSSQIFDDVNTNIILFIHDKIFSNLDLDYRLNRINGQYINHIINLKFNPKYIKLGFGFETLTRNLKLSMGLQLKSLSIFTNGIVHPELGISKMIGIEVKI
jgi:hypothetical protein